MNAIEDSDFRRNWQAAARSFPKPLAVLCVSAHWETQAAALSAATRPETIHDFHGFPRELYDVYYPAPGDPALAREVAALIKRAKVTLNPDRGLDHGSWSVLKAMYPEADVPVVQLSLDTALPAAHHYALAEELASLRDGGILILGSGNMVHNLRLMNFDEREGFDWADRVNVALRARILEGDHAALVQYEALDPDMRLAVPTPEHYLPLLYVLAVKRPGEMVAVFNDRIVMGSISMTCVLIR